MTTRMHRTQILLEPEQHQALTEIAQREKRSLSDVVREMLQVQLEHRRQDATAAKKRRLENLQRIQRHREAILNRRGVKLLEIDVVELINQMRDEGNAELTRFIKDRG